MDCKREALINSIDYCFQLSVDAGNWEAARVHICWLPGEEIEGTFIHNSWCFMVDREGGRRGWVGLNVVRIVLPQGLGLFLGERPLPCSESWH